MRSEAGVAAESGAGPVRPASPPARRYATLAAGWTLLAAGGALLVLPGPGIPLVLGGLALLGREAPWARRAQERLRARLLRLAGRTEPAAP